MSQHAFKPEKQNVSIILHPKAVSQKARQRFFTAHLHVRVHHVPTACKLQRSSAATPWMQRHSGGCTAQLLSPQVNKFLHIQHPSFEGSIHIYAAKVLCESYLRPADSGSIVDSPLKAQNPISLGSSGEQ